MSLEEGSVEGPGILIVDDVVGGGGFRGQRCAVVVVVAPGQRLRVGEVEKVAFAFRPLDPLSLELLRRPFREHLDLLRVVRAVSRSTRALLLGGDCRALKSVDFLAVQTEQRLDHQQPRRVIHRPVAQQRPQRSDQLRGFVRVVKVGDAAAGEVFERGKRRRRERMRLELVEGTLVVFAVFIGCVVFPVFPVSIFVRGRVFRAR